MSAFRKWFNYLGGFRGRRVEWPQLLRRLFDDEITQLHAQGTPYEGDVFKDRDVDCFRHELHPQQHREDVCIPRLYRKVHQEQNGGLEVGGKIVWLISYEVPNQADERHCCADLLGLQQDGSLVVFECKVGSSQCSPLYSVLEGL